MLNREGVGKQNPQSRKKPIYVIHTWEDALIPTDPPEVIEFDLLLPPRSPLPLSSSFISDTLTSTSNEVYNDPEFIICITARFVMHHSS